MSVGEYKGFPVCAVQTASDLKKLYAIYYNRHKIKDEDRWITLENGSRVLLGKNGEIKGGMGGKYNGMTLEEMANASAGNSPQDITKLMGPEYKNLKGQQAIDKLLQEKQGHVKGAFYRKEIGSIDLLWGKTDDEDGRGFGLAHIIERRNEQGFDGAGEGYV